MQEGRAEVAELGAIKNAADGILEEARLATRDTLCQRVEALPPEEKRASFWHASIDEDDCCHNYYAYRAHQCEESFREKRTVLDRLLNTITDRLQSPVNRRDTLYRQVLSLDVAGDAPVARTLLEALRTALQPTPTATVPESGTPQMAASLGQLIQVLDERFGELSRAVGAIESCRDTWDRAWEAETAFREALRRGRSHLAAVRAKFDLPEHTGTLADLEAFLGEGEAKYRVLCQQAVEVEARAFDNVRKELLTLTEHFQEVDKLVQSELWHPFSVKHEGVLTTLGKRVQACHALGDLPDAVRDQYRSLAERLEQQHSLEEFLQGSASCTEELGEVGELSRRTGEILRRHLSMAENSVLTRIIELSGQIPGAGGINLDTLKEQMATGEQDQILGIVGGLWAKGVIAVRIGI